MIINPWYFYALQLFTNLRGSLIALGTVLLIFGIICFIENDISHKSYKVTSKLIAGMICLIVALMIPSRETLLLMKAAEFVTYDNANLTVEALKSAIDYAATLF